MFCYVCIYLSSDTHKRLTKQTCNHHCIIENKLTRTLRAFDLKDNYGLIDFCCYRSADLLAELARKLHLKSPVKGSDKYSVYLLRKQHTKTVFG